MVQRRAARFAKLLFFKFIKEVSKMCHLVIKYYLTIRQGTTKIVNIRKRHSIEIESIVGTRQQQITLYSYIH